MTDWMWRILQLMKNVSMTRHGNGFRVAREYVSSREAAALLGLGYIEPGENEMYVLTAAGLTAWAAGPPSGEITGRCDGCGITCVVRPVRLGDAGVLLCDRCAEDAADAAQGRGAWLRSWMCDGCGAVTTRLTTRRGERVCDRCLRTLVKEASC